MEITINIENYVNEERLKQIVEDELRNTIQSILYNKFRRESEINRMIANISYEIIFKAISDAIEEDAEVKIANTVKHLLEDDSHIRYLLWRKKDAWENEESPAVTAMNEAIKDNKQLIRNKVMQTIDQFEFNDVKTAVYEALESACYEKVFGKTN